MNPTNLPELSKRCRDARDRWKTLGHEIPEKFLGNLREISWTFPETFPDCAGNVHHMSGKFPGKSLEMCMTFPGTFWKISWKYPRNVLDISRTLPGHFPYIFGKFPRNVREISRTFPGHFRLVLTNFPGNFRQRFWENIPTGRRARPLCRVSPFP